MLVSIESEIFSDQLVYDKILIGKVRAIGRRVVESAEDLSADACAYLGEYSAFLEGLLEDFLQFVDTCHLI